MPVHAVEEEVPKKAVVEEAVVEEAVPERAIAVPVTVPWTMALPVTDLALPVTDLSMALPVTFP